MKTTKLVDVNKKLYKVFDTEFNKLESNFVNLNILDSLGILERVSGLLNELSSVFDKKLDIFCFDIYHGGFIPLQIHNKYKNIYIHNNEEQNIYNIMYNSEQENTEFFYFKDYEKIMKNYKEEHIEFINNDKIEFDASKNISVCIMKTNSSKYNDDYIKYQLTNTEYFIYIRKDIHEKFLKEFNYYILTEYSESENIHKYYLNFDNLIHLCMIVKNAGDKFEDILIENFPFFDRWTILDTGSTDGTQNVIKKILSERKKGKLYEEPFINFRDSRNRSLDLCGTDCKFIVVLDDTYILKKDLRLFLSEIRGDQFADTYSLFIESNDTEYGSNRILKSNSEIRYKYKIHEVLDPKNNINVIIPQQCAYIFDYRSDYMEKRTMDRKKYDLELLKESYEEDPNDSRPLYYLGQTYNLIEDYENALKYFLERVNHPDEGFIQEKLDACFESARLCNFRLNRPWEECEALYKRTFELDNSRPEPMYFLGIHYYLEQNYTKAYEYLKKGFEIGYPIHCQYALKPTLSFFYLPKFLSEVCFIVEDYCLGFEVSKFFLKNNNDDNFSPEYQTVKCWNKICDKMMSLQNNSATINTVPLNSKPLFVFVADGGFNLWKGSDINEIGVGGSETFIIEITRQLQKKNIFDIYVFCKCSHDEIFDGVNYQSLVNLPSFVKNNKIHTCMISRYPEYLPMMYKNNVENVHLILHDLIPTGEVIIKNEKLKNIFCLTEWHRQQFLSLFPEMISKSKVLNYGINISDFQNSQIKKNPYQFVYSSFPHRGLLELLQMWPDIVKRYPIANLQIHCDVNNEWVNTVQKEHLQEIKSLLNKYNEKPDYYRVHYRGWTSKKELYDTFIRSEVWFYPCTFLETFCLTALEAAITKNLVITSSLGALQETVGERGIMIPGEPQTLNWKQKAISALFSVLEDSRLKNSLIEKNYQWAKSMTWKKRCDELLNIVYPQQNNDDEDFVFIKKQDVDKTNMLSGNSFVIPSKILDYFNFKVNKKPSKVLEIGNNAFSKEIILKSLIDGLENVSISSICEKNNFKDEEKNPMNIFIEKYQSINYQLIDDFLKFILTDTNVYDMIIFVDNIDDSIFNVLLSYSKNILKKGGIFGFINNTSNQTSLQQFLEKEKNSFIVLQKDSEQIFIETKM